VDDPRRILVRLPNWVGDVVMATPALRALREAHPAARITVEGRPFLEGLLRELPTVDAFLPDGARGLRATWTRGRRLAAERFDWAVLLPDSARAAAGPFLARVPRRVGYARDPLRRALLTEALDPPAENGRRVPVPMVERYLRITRALGCADPPARTELRVGAPETERVASMLAAQGVDSGAPVLVVTPGAHFGSSKLYPPESFARACDGIVDRLGLRCVLAPAPSEIDLARHVVGRMERPAVVLDDPPTTLEELKALVARSALVLSNDTGPRHVAVALDRPVVVLMGPTDPRHTASQLERQRVLREDVECSPCHEKTCPIDHRCMTRLAPERVVAAALELVGRPATREVAP